MKEVNLMTNYEFQLQSMDVQKFAQKNVNLILVNNSELYYLTSTGQLFPFTAEGLRTAVAYEYQWLCNPCETSEDVNISATEVEKD